MVFSKLVQILFVLANLVISYFNLLLLTFFGIDMLDIISKMKYRANHFFTVKLDFKFSYFFLIFFLKFLKFASSVNFLLGKLFRFLLFFFKKIINFFLIMAALINFLAGSNLKSNFDTVFSWNFLAYKSSGFNEKNYIWKFRQDNYKGRGIKPYRFKYTYLLIGMFSNFILHLSEFFYKFLKLIFNLLVTPKIIKFLKFDEIFLKKVVWGVVFFWATNSVSLIFHFTLFFWISVNSWFFIYSFYNFFLLNFLIKNLSFVVDFIDKKKSGIQNFLNDYNFDVKQQYFLNYDWREYMHRFIDFLTSSRSASPSPEPRNYSFIRNRNINLRPDEVLNKFFPLKQEEIELGFQKFYNFSEKINFNWNDFVDRSLFYDNVKYLRAREWIFPHYSREYIAGGPHHLYVYGPKRHFWPENYDFPLGFYYVKVKNTRIDFVFNTFPEHYHFPKVTTDSHYSVVSDLYQTMNEFFFFCNSSDRLIDDIFLFPTIYSSIYLLIFILLYLFLYGFLNSIVMIFKFDFKFSLVNIFFLIIYNILILIFCFPFLVISSLLYHFLVITIQSIIFVFYFINRLINLFELLIFTIINIYVYLSWFLIVKLSYYFFNFTTPFLNFFTQRLLFIIRNFIPALYYPYLGLTRLIYFLLDFFLNFFIFEFYYDFNVLKIWLVKLMTKFMLILPFPLRFLLHRFLNFVRGPLIFIYSLVSLQFLYPFWEFAGPYILKFFHTIYFNNFFFKYTYKQEALADIFISVPHTMWLFLFYIWIGIPWLIFNFVIFNRHLIRFYARFFIMYFLMFLYAYRDILVGVSILISRNLHEAEIFLDNSAITLDQIHVDNKVQDIPSTLSEEDRKYLNEVEQSIRKTFDTTWNLGRYTIDDQQAKSEDLYYKDFFEELYQTIEESKRSRND